MVLALVGYSSWNDTDGMDGSTGYDSTTQFDGSQDASVFWDDWIATHFTSYVSSGTRDSNPIILDTYGTVESASLLWTSDIPAGTNVEMSISVDGGNTFVPVANGESIPIMLGSASGKQTVIRTSLSTTNPLVTPSVSSMTLSIENETDILNIEYVPQGVFMLSAPTTSSKADGTREVTFQGDDKWHQFDGQPLGTFANPVTITKGTNIGTAITTLAQQFGETKFAFDACDVTVPYDMTYQPGEAVGKAMKDLAAIPVYSLFYDVDGYLRFRPINQNLTTSPSVWTYDKSEYTLYAGADKTFDESQLYNRVLVLGGSSQTATVSAIASNDDPNSPISTVNIGVRLFVYNNGSPDPLITTQDLAQARADYELQQRARIVETQNFTALPNFLQDAEDIVTLVDDWTSTNGKYQITKLNIPFKAGNMMTGSVWRVTGVGS
ncbi:hypothetical protein [Alicyclobacillus dauci]|uniref:F5/8 type C domain-containing protein n=1 Tax=Alicyclobacillus dauci TaxID=1475485 RepID=A0ABY6Z7J5_9BACL|nr:hypothetical protein [Alicyclobacillus dauci]WAH38241.1 hypothetical protein NZD86_07100 [Alicyclobacillus dauci]